LSANFIFIAYNGYYGAHCILGVAWLELYERRGAGLVL